MKTPWDAFEHRMVNMFPQNPTQTAYVRFQPLKFQLPANGFDDAMRDFQKKQDGILQTHYLELLGDNDDRYDTTK